MANLADVVKEIIDLLLVVRTGWQGTGKGILVFEEQGDRQGDFKLILREE